MRFTQNIAKRIGSGLAVLKDFGVTSIGDYGWNPLGGNRTSARRAGSDLNWQDEAGDVTLNAVVAICCKYITDKVSVPNVHVVYEDVDEMLQPVPKHPCTNLLRWANPEYRGRQLIAALAISYMLNGNAYAVKVRGQGGKGAPKELWFVAPWQMNPLAPDDGGPTQFYKFTRGDGTHKLFARADVVHIRFGLDPANPRLGLSPFRAMLPVTVTDNEIDLYTAILMRNCGVAGAVVSRKDMQPGDTTASITPDQQEEFKRRVIQSMTGDNRAGVLFSSLPVDINFIGRSPEELGIEKMGDRPMSRICGAFGIDPMAVGLASNIGKGGQYGAKQKEARESSYEQCILPFLSVASEAFSQDLLPDFTTSSSVNSASQEVSYRVEFDYSKVKDLQEDADSVHTRAQGDFKAGGTKLDEFRMAIGLKPEPDTELGEKYFWQLTPAPTGDVGVVDPDNPADAPVAGGGSAGKSPEIPEEDDEDDEG